MDDQKKRQEEIIRLLIRNLAAANCEMFVLTEFEKKLRENKEVAILDLLRDLRESPQIRAAYASAGTSLEAVAESVLGKTPLDQVEELIRTKLPRAKEPR
jgi:hypothetical protein